MGKRRILSQGLIMLSVESEKVSAQVQYLLTVSIVWLYSLCQPFGLSSQISTSQISKSRRHHHPPHLSRYVIVSKRSIHLSIVQSLHFFIPSIYPAPEPALQILITGQAETLHLAGHTQGLNSDAAWARGDFWMCDNTTSGCIRFKMTAA